MALDPILWAMKDAPATDAYERLVLLVYAEKADEDGCNAFPAPRTVAERAMCDEQTVKDRVKRLRKRGLLATGDQSAAAYLPANRRPRVYDVMIPYSWWGSSGIERVNRARAERGRAPITPGVRPDVMAPGERKRRADAGQRRQRLTALGDVVDPPGDPDPDTPWGDVVDPAGGVYEIPHGGMPETPNPLLGPSPEPSYLSGNVPPAVVEPEGQEAEPPEETPDQDPAAELLAAIEWPSGWRLDAGTRRTLRELAGRCLQAGHAPAVVAAEAAAGIPGATGPGATVRRLQALAESVPAPGPAADVAARQAERDAAGRTPHQPVPGQRAGYCSACGHHDYHRIHPQTPAVAESGERCPHDRRPGVCLDCRPTSPTAATRPPAPRQPAEPEQSALAALDQVLAEMAVARSMPTSTSDPAGAVASEPHLAPVAT